MTRSHLCATAALLGSLALFACDDSKSEQSAAQDKPQKPAKVIYRYRGKDGSLHFTDDKESIPPDAKVEETTGADIKVVAMPKIDAGPTLVGSESEWRARFKETRRLIAQLEATVTADEKIAGAAEKNEMVEEAMANDENFNAALRRLRAARKELERQKAALKDLHGVADIAKVPADWRD